MNFTLNLSSSLDTWRFTHWATLVYKTFSVWFLRTWALFFIEQPFAQGKLMTWLYLEFELKLESCPLLEYLHIELKLLDLVAFKTSCSILNSFSSVYALTIWLILTCFLSFFVLPITAATSWPGHPPNEILGLYRGKWRNKTNSIQSLTCRKRLNRWSFFCLVLMSSSADGWLLQKVPTLILIFSSSSPLNCSQQHIRFQAFPGVNLLIWQTFHHSSYVHVMNKDFDKDLISRGR